MQQTIGTVSKIYRYPVSSLSGEALQRVSVTESGVDGDRAYALFAAETGDIVFPSILKKWNVAPQIFARYGDEYAVQLSLDGRAWLTPDGPECLDGLKTLFGESMVLRRYGDMVGGRRAENRYALSPVHLLSCQALAALKVHLPGHDVDVRRFRPNILVDLPGLPGDQPELALIGKEFSIGGLRLRGTRPSGRCSFTTLAQPGIPEDRDVLRALIKDFGKDFGIYCDVVRPAEIELGNPVCMELSQKPIVIVGAGQAGAMMAKSLRSLGYEGPLQLFGEERHLPYERPPLSKGFDFRGDGGAGTTRVLQPSEFDDLDIELNLSSRVVGINRESLEVETQDGGRHPYEKLVIATGGSAKRLPGIERGHGRVHVVRTLDDASNLWRALKPGSKLAVLGSGWLGLEVAAAARMIGCAVDLFARQNRILSRTVPKDVAAFIQERHRCEGVGLRLGETPAFRETADRVEIAVAGGAEEADHLVLAIGITPNDHLARMAGLTVSDGIVTDGSGRTSDENIYAVGDVARWDSGRGAKSVRIESWQNANDQPLAAARAILSLPPAPAPLMKFWSAQFDMMIQIAGLPDPDAAAVDIEGSENPFWNFGAFAVGINRPRDIHNFVVEANSRGDPEPSSPARPEEQKPRTPMGPPGGVFVGSPEDFPEGGIRRVDVAGFGSVAIARFNGEIYAVNDKCPHADASLSEGFTERRRIVCPLHFAEFDLRTGEAFNAPPGCGRVACYEIERRENGVYLIY